MAKYVDGYVLPVAKKNLQAYRRLAQKALSWILFKSRAHRDRVNAKVMKDPRLMNMDLKSMPFDSKRIVYGGFRILLEA